MRAFPRLSALTPVTLAALGMLAMLGATRAEAALPYSVTIRNFFGTMTFTRPVHFVPYQGEDSAYVVVQQNGKLMTVRRVGGAWARTDSAVVTVNGGTSVGNEQGLLGFAFHPNFATNRKYYIYYIGGTGNGIDVIAERTADVSLHPKTADAQRTLLRLTDPYSNHNGGTLHFGKDGYLYFALGDGGSGGDPEARAQNKGVHFGKVLRLNVDGVDAFPTDTTRNYAIPADNPFVDSSAYLPEIWALGVRNPWKWSFHPVSGQLWLGDVGQDAQEEISLVTKGANMGWKIREGNACYSPSTGCTTVGLTPAKISIPQPTAQSITGGVFFLGNPTAAFHGVYFFGDYVTDSVWAARIVNDSVTERIRVGTVNTVSSFNLDNQGRVFALNVDNGVVNILESPDMTPAPTGIRRDRREGLKPIRRGDLIRNPGAYELHGLDGGKITGLPSGIFLVTQKGLASHPSLMTLP
jgi:glucose/arabinose dehydrogenase